MGLPPFFFFFEKWHENAMKSLKLMRFGDHDLKLHTQLPPLKSQPFPRPGPPMEKDNLSARFFSLFVRCFPTCVTGLIFAARGHLSPPPASIFFIARTRRTFVAAAHYVLPSIHAFFPQLSSR